ncbi:D-Ala-D-Ala carboxypeptidase family metallohydrolase [Gilliamella sp. ESL0250]|uniref:D-Ala-D-Ala carboxypeptidase family metallohydrolase n=1 Tax=Gilliamella sp. ESL0250 TaxID=2705036 RepID=UPI0015803C98|nr:D-Ala-D-Ala carboxypeptidase family metallohydrolase [Gilliamella sp. ESL0250]NUF48726.1 peptidase M15 [Gilliamella sp. ESL0250]
MTKLTEHFTLEEFIRSTTANKLKIDNSVPADLMPNVQLTAIKLELVRKVLGKPIIITSGYRCSALNSRVGGVSTSAHTKGLAVDFKSSFGTPKEICQQLVDAGVQFDKLIQEHNQWVHIGFSPTHNRQIVLTAVKQDGKTVYLSGLK